MLLRHLKKIRIAVSLFVAIFLFLIFLDKKDGIIEPVAEFLMQLQFFPSIFSTIALFFSITTMGFVLVLLITFLWGRVYCSSICPLGTFQDLLIAVGRIFKSRKKRQFTYSPNKKILLKYSALAATLTLWVFGSLFLINILDPFSNFGKITVTLFKPAYIWLNNQLAFTLENFEIFAVTPMMPISFPGEVIAVSAGIFVVLAVMSIWRGRLFCNTLCPVGSILGIVSQKSLYRIAIKGEACNLCRRCEKVCKAECIDSKSHSIDHARCVSCFNCFSACTNNGFYYKNSLIKVSADKGIEGSELPDPSKRTFLLTMASAALSIPILSRANAQVSSASGMIPTGSISPVMPPGAISYENFTGKCTACYRCVSACTKNVIIPSFFGYGLDGFMQPRMDFHKSYCNFDCTNCSNSCPTGALRPLDLPTKQTTQIGIAKFMYESCIVTVYGTDCGACSEHCPVKAVDMVPYGNVWLPEVKPELCIGCGACEFACPTLPYKAIYVESNRVHKRALPPAGGDGPRDHEMEEFPF